MKVEGSIPAPLHVRNGPLKEAGLEGFAEVLGHMSKDGPGGKNAAMSAAAITPQIGDRAISFSDKPMVLLTALEFDHPSQIFEGASEFFSGRIAHIPDAYWLGTMSSFSQGVSDIVERNREWGRLAFHVPADSMRNLAPQTPTSVPPVSAKQTAVQTLAPSVATKTEDAPSADRKDSASFQKATAEIAESAAARNAERAGSRTAVLANLYAVEDGFRLVLRTPAMKADEHSELMRRLAGLFAEHGKLPPELLIYHPETNDQG